MICPNCGFQVHPAESNCRNCHAPLPQPAQHKSSRSMLIMILAGLLLALFVLIVFIFLGINRELQQSATQVQLDEPATAVFSPYLLSQNQIQQIQRLGYPPGFSLLFYQQADAAGNLVSVRHETWIYPGSGLTLTFINGSLVDEVQEERMDAVVIPAAYRPEQFSADMSLQQVLASTEVQRYLRVPMERELIPQGELYVAKQLMFGLQADQLRYIETIPLEESP